MQQGPESLYQARPGTYQRLETVRGVSYISDNDPEIFGNRRTKRFGVLIRNVWNEPETPNNLVIDVFIAKDQDRFSHYGITIDSAERVSRLTAEGYDFISTTRVSTPIIPPTLVEVVQEIIIAGRRQSRLKSQNLRDLPRDREPRKSLLDLALITQTVEDLERVSGGPQTPWDY